MIYRGVLAGNAAWALANHAEKAGISKNVTPYLLRHSFATVCGSLGIEMDVARRIMRHTSTKMMKQVYARPRPADLAKKLAGFALSA